MIAKQYQGSFFFDPKDPVYKDHFPGRPVVPGSLVMQAFLEAIQRMGLTATCLSRFRFKTFVPPGSYPYELTLSAGIARCRLLCGSKELACGKIFYDVLQSS